MHRPFACDAKIIRDDNAAFRHDAQEFPLSRRLAERAMTELDPKKREALYIDLQTLAYREAPGFSIHNALRFRTQRNWVKGYVADPVFPDAPYSCPLYYLEKTPP